MLTLCRKFRTKTQFHWLPAQCIQSTNTRFTKQANRIITNATSTTYFEHSVATEYIDIIINGRQCEWTCLSCGLAAQEHFWPVGLSDVTSQVTRVNAGIEPVCQENVHCINHWAQLTQQHNSHPKTNWDKLSDNRQQQLQRAAWGWVDGKPADSPRNLWE